MLVTRAGASSQLARVCPRLPSSPIVLHSSSLLSSVRVAVTWPLHSRGRGVKKNNDTSTRAHNTPAWLGGGGGLVKVLENHEAVLILIVN